MPYFVRDGESKHRGGIGPGLIGQPLHPIDEHRCERAGARLGVDEGVSELKHPVSIRLRRQARKADRDLRARQWRLTACGRCVRRAHHPGSLDTGSGQDPGRRTQSNRLIRCRHLRHVVDAHPQLGSNLRSAFARGLYDT